MPELTVAALRQALLAALPHDGTPIGNVCLRGELAESSGKEVPETLYGPQNKAKRAALDAWVQGVNQKGEFGPWCWDVAFQPSMVNDILQAHGSNGTTQN